MSSWQRLGRVEPSSLRQARLAAHALAQVPAAVSRAVIPAAPDDSHTSLSWLPEQGALAGEPILEAGDLRIALLPARQALVTLSAGGSLTPIGGAGAALPALLDAAAEALEQAGLERPALSVPDYDLPREPYFAEGIVPEVDEAAAVELAATFANAALVLGELATEHREATPIRCWPHHFDLATLLAIDPPERGESARSIGVGLSPGDDSIEQPYWYVNPWPRVDASRAQAVDSLPAGRWNHAFLGGLLEHQEIVAAGDAAAQQARVQAFIDATVRIGLAELET